MLHTNTHTHTHTHTQTHTHTHTHTYIYIYIYISAFVVEWSKSLATDSEVRVRFTALSDFLRSSESGTGSTQPREYNRAAT
jgi:hypothetical protein